MIAPAMKKACGSRASRATPFVHHNVLYDAVEILNLAATTNVVLKPLCLCFRLPSSACHPSGLAHRGPAGPLAPMDDGPEKARELPLLVRVPRGSRWATARMRWVPLTFFGAT